jgi:hypothetical protein
VDLATLCVWIGAFGIVSSILAQNVVFRRLKRAGLNPGWQSTLSFPRCAREYLKIRVRFGWSALPVHLAWIMIVLGFSLTVLGLVLTHHA